MPLAFYEGESGCGMGRAPRGMRLTTRGGILAATRTPTAREELPGRVVRGKGSVELTAPLLSCSVSEVLFGNPWQSAHVRYQM